MHGIDAIQRAGYPCLPIGRLSCIRNCLRLLEATSMQSGAMIPETQYQMWFSFALIWGVGSIITNAAGRHM